MDKIKKRIYKYSITLLTGGIAGFLAGVVLLGLLVSYRFDCYHQQIAKLESRITDDAVKVKKLEDAVNSKKYVVKDIEVILGFTGHDLDKITLEKSIREKYSSLLGKDIKSIDIDMAAEVVDKRVMKLKDGEYKLKLEKLLLSDILKLWVKVEKLVFAL